MRSPSGPERLCPRCKGGEFRRGFSSVTGYWAGQVLVPVICSRCYYNVGFGIQTALPHFEPAAAGTSQAAGRVHSPGTTQDDGPRMVWSGGRARRAPSPRSDSGLGGTWGGCAHSCRDILRVQVYRFRIGMRGELHDPNTLAESSGASKTRMLSTDWANGHLT